MLVLPDSFLSPNMSTEVNLRVLEAFVSSSGSRAMRTSAVPFVGGVEGIRSSSSSKGTEPSRCWTLFIQALPFHETDYRTQEESFAFDFLIMFTGFGRKTTQTEKRGNMERRADTFDWNPRKISWGQNWHHPNTDINWGYCPCPTLLIYCFYFASS